MLLCIHSQLLPVLPLYSIYIALLRMVVVLGALLLCIGVQAELHLYLYLCSYCYVLRDDEEAMMFV
jgi:hypothetical protein